MHYSFVGSFMDFEKQKKKQPPNKNVHVKKKLIKLIHLFSVL